MAEITDAPDSIEDYVAELGRLNHAIEDAAARTDFEDAGHVFTELLKYQHEHRQLAAQAAWMIDLNRGPSRAARLPKAR